MFLAKDVRTQSAKRTRVSRAQAHKLAVPRGEQHGSQHDIAPHPARDRTSTLTRSLRADSCKRVCRCVRACARTCAYACACACACTSRQARFPAASARSHSTEHSTTSHYTARDRPSTLTRHVRSHARLNILACTCMCGRVRLAFQYNKVTSPTRAYKDETPTRGVGHAGGLPVTPAPR